jgi:hypothetical protein
VRKKKKKILEKENRGREDRAGGEQGRDCQKIKTYYQKI